MAKLLFVVVVMLGGVFALAVYKSNMTDELAVELCVDKIDTDYALYNAKLKKTKTVYSIYENLFTNWVVHGNVTGVVMLQNGFGAWINTDFECFIIDDRVTIFDLTFKNLKLHPFRSI